MYIDSDASVFMVIVGSGAVIGVDGQVFGSERSTRIVRRDRKRVERR